MRCQKRPKGSYKPSRLHEDHRQADEAPKQLIQHCGTKEVRGNCRIAQDTWSASIGRSSSCPNLNSFNKQRLKDGELEARHKEPVPLEATQESHQAGAKAVDGVRQAVATPQASQDEDGTH